MLPTNLRTTISETVPESAKQQLPLSVFFLPSFDGGGAEKVIVQIASRLAQRNHAVHILVGNGRGPCRKLVHEKVKIIDFELDSVTRCIPALVKYIRVRKPDALVSTMLHANLSVAIASFFFSKKTRLIAREALPLSMEMRQSVKLGLLTRLLYRRFDAYISMTRCQERDRLSVLNLNSSEKDWIIPNPVEIKKLRELSIAPIPAKLPPSFKNQPTIVACGRLSKQKGFDVLLRAFAEARKSFECSLVILGDGEERIALETLAMELGVDKQVWMPGFIENPHPFISECEVFVLSSWNEGMPNALLQAYALGKKCVATDCQCGPAEIFEYPGTSRLVKVGDHVDMSDAILEMLALPESAERHVFTENSYYDIDSVCDKFCEVLELLPAAEYSR